MAFCTTCGASVQGAFCPQCGTPLSAATGQGAPAPAPTSGPVASPAMAAPGAIAPVRRKHGPLFWILMIILGMFVLLIVALVGIGWYVARNPGMALAKIVTAGNPNVEVLSTDNGARTITFRDRRTGKETTISFDDIKNGRLRLTAEDENGKTATVELGAAGKLPSWIPTYPGAGSQGTFSVKGDTGDDTEEGGTMTFVTSDAASKVLSFYQDKAPGMGMKITMNTATPDGGMVVIADEDERRTLSVIVGSQGGKTSISLTYAVKK